MLCLGMRLALLGTRMPGSYGLLRGGQKGQEGHWDPQGSSSFWSKVCWVRTGRCWWERTAKAMGCTAHMKPQIGDTHPLLLPEQPRLWKRRGIPVQNKASVTPRRLFCTPQPPCQILQIRSVAKPGGSRSCRWDGGWRDGGWSPPPALPSQPNAADRLSDVVI